MSDEYLIVAKKLLPKCYEKVVEAKKLLQDGRTDSVSKACEMTGISRSTFYKYQENVFSYDEDQSVRKLVISFNLSHTRGSLSKVCEVLSGMDISILTVSQAIPIDDVAAVMASLDISAINIPLDGFRERMNAIPEISQFKVISFER